MTLSRFASLSNCLSNTTVVGRLLERQGGEARFCLEQDGEKCIQSINRVLRGLAPTIGPPTKEEYLMRTLTTTRAIAVPGADSVCPEGVARLYSALSPNNFRIATMVTESCM